MKVKIRKKGYRRVQRKEKMTRDDAEHVHTAAFVFEALTDLEGGCKHLL